MFLTKGELWHEASWAAWFRNIGGAYPKGHLFPGSCNQTAQGAIPRLPLWQLFIAPTPCNSVEMSC